MTQDERNWLRLHLARGLGRKGLIRLREVFGSTDAILEADPPYRAARSGLSPKLTAAIPEASDSAFLKACEALERIGARVIDLWDPDYPPLLRTIHDPPALLYLRGTLPPQASGALAVVGARLATTAGRRLTAAICSELASRGIAIVSGLARGIDTAAHQGALDGNGPTVAVLGCGIDRVYPAENARLFAQILEQGAILSEYPPGTPPLAGHFPGRNRIISGLSRGVLVVEARTGSGSLITAEFALEQGRDVFAVPGPVSAPTSRGVNQLLKDGALLVTEPQDILDALWPQLPSAQTRKQEDALAASLSGNALTLYRQVENTPLHIDDLARKSGLTPMEVSAILLHLELLGGVEKLPGMHFVRSEKA